MQVHTERSHEMLKYLRLQLYLKFSADLKTPVSFNTHINPGLFLLFCSVFQPNNPALAYVEDIRPTWLFDRLNKRVPTVVINHSKVKHLSMLSIST